MLLQECPLEFTFEIESSENCFHHHHHHPHSHHHHHAKIYLHYFIGDHDDDNWTD